MFIEHNIHQIKAHLNVYIIQYLLYHILYLTFTLPYLYRDVTFTFNLLYVVIHVNK